MSTENDFSLLRPFDLEAAKRGDLLCDKSGRRAWKYEAGPDANGNIVTTKDGVFIMPFRPEEVRMDPLCWVEGKPVYKGDSVYGKHNGHKYTAGEVSWEPADREQYSFLYFDAEDLLWTPPKVKREIKLLAWIDRNGELRRVDENTPTRDGWKRVPSEDKVITVEEPAGQEGGA